MVSKFLTPIAGHFGSPKAPEPSPEEKAVAAYRAQKDAELKVRLLGNEETRRFQEAVADFVIREMGVASAMTADDVHLTVRRVMAGSASTMFLDKAVAEMRQKRATLGKKLPDHRQMEACLGSAVVSQLVKRRLGETLKHEMEAEALGDDPEDADAPRRKTPLPQ